MPPTTDPVSRARPDDDPASMLSAFAKKRVLVVGDIVADQYLYGETDRVSREAPVLIVRYESSETTLGGAGNAAANLRAMARSLKCAVKLAHRYAAIAEEKAAENEVYALMAHTLRHVPEFGARNTYEAMQSFLLLWQVMCVEQAPNPFAFSVGNADRIFEPYRAADGLTRAEASALFRHFLVFFNVASEAGPFPRMSSSADGIPQETT